MDLKDISTQLLYTTVPIWVRKQNGVQTMGTGFIYSVPVPDEAERTVPILVTNLHVVSQGQSALIEMVERTGDGPKLGNRIRIEVPPVELGRHVDEAHDLAGIPLGGILNQLEEAGRPAFFRSVTPELVPSQEVIDDLAAMEDVTFIGYPSGLYDEHNVTPLIRRGITATPPWNDFAGQPTFLIDAGVFPGSSGSPVFIFNQGAYAVRQGLTIGNRLLFMGVLSESFLRHQEGIPEVYLGLGKVIKAESVRAFVNRVAEELLARQVEE